MPVFCQSQFAGQLFATPLHTCYTAILRSDGANVLSDATIAGIVDLVVTLTERLGCLEAAFCFSFVVADTMHMIGRVRRCAALTLQHFMVRLSEGLKCQRGRCPQGGRVIAPH